MAASPRPLPHAFAKLSQQIHNALSIRYDVDESVYSCVCRVIPYRFASLSCRSGDGADEQEADYVQDFTAIPIGQRFR